MSRKRLRQLRRSLKLLEGRIDALGCVGLALMTSHPEPSRLIARWQEVELDWFDEAYDRAGGASTEYLVSFHSTLALYSQLVQDMATAISERREAGDLH